MQSLKKKGTIKYKQSNKFNYQLKQNQPLNLHHLYFELYDKYTNNLNHLSQSQPEKYHQSQTSNHLFTLQQNNKSTQSYLNTHNQYQKQQSFQLNNPFPKIDEWLNDQNKRIMLENNRLSKELLQKSIQNENLKKDLQQCRVQLLKIKDLAKIQQYHHKDTVLELTQQIQIILDNNKSMISQIRELKNIINNLSQQKYYSSYKYQIDRQIRSKSYSKQTKNERYYRPIQQQEEYNFKKITQLFNSIKQMYKKIMGLQLTSLKQLWRWLKSVGLCFSNLKKWKTRTIGLLKSGFSLSNQRFVDVLKEVCQIIV